MSWKKELDAATAEFRRAGFHLERAETLVTAQASSIPAPDAGARKQASLAAKLSQSAQKLTPGFLGEDLNQLPPDTPPREQEPPSPVHIRIGTAEAVPGAEFPVVVPLFGRGHLVLDGDAADAKVAGLLRSALVRCVASMPRLKVSLVDCVALGKTFTDAATLVKADIMAPTVTDAPGLERLVGEAEHYVQEVLDARHQGAAELPHHLIVIAGFPPSTSSALRGRIAALAHAGPHGRTHFILAGWRAESEHQQVPAIDHATYVNVGETVEVQNVPAPVTLDAPPSPTLTHHVFHALADKHRKDSQLDMGALLPPDRWRSSSVAGLSTVVGRDPRGDVELAFDDVTPHWLIGGRSGGGKTVFLLDVLYGLASRYGPRELALYLLDFKEGVSFTEFSPQPRDKTWMPHVKAVGVESDREYGKAVLVELRKELSRRATAMKRAGVTKLADLRQVEPDRPLPRILAVIDEFQVLFAGNDRLAREAADHLEELARKGRSYGVHLILASQTISGVEALYTKKDSIFGQFPMRVALPGARNVLDEVNNTAADAIRLGQAVVNNGGGVKGFNRLIHFPDATAATDELTALRHELWQQREPDDLGPRVFQGFAEQHLADDPVYNAVGPGGLRRKALVGRAVDVDVSTVGFGMEPVPGRNLAVLGTSTVGADVLQAAVLSLAKQHEPGSARFELVGLAAQADVVVTETAAALSEAGHEHEVTGAADLDKILVAAENHDHAGQVRYVVVFGGDAISQIWNISQLMKFRALLKSGPTKGVHLLGWWRGFKRFSDDIGGSAGKEDVACLVALNVPGGDFGPFIGDLTSDYEPRENRALVFDRHDNTRRLIVPFVRPGRETEVGF
ncbi:FtsK/SpoIIIE domain-containing protein [Stackebrandtia nassauensis]|uniref:Cell division FtsK/SpoIIIE n=1 Tax=Stackebrandtia nassauensis (strain DSM 44728 / CIP 108903 / NRRL B-16338 / NBRC 102104 / LLR-40K-21) TaxID=446470 RepID=D3Q1V7_STANL|nr:FtsK/SpoIIIE domain-containing protein [Stackebrandtia nassauensis]ADD41824.1 cell division FtsK/SpoIIIE [Stackebrandtia nassauensis DSM 44728]